MQPVQDSISSKYNNLSDKGRFLAGACVGYGASRLAVGSKWILCNGHRAYNILRCLLAYCIKDRSIMKFMF